MNDVGNGGGRYRIEALARGLAVLRAFDGGAMKVTEIAQKTGMQVATAFRVVATLEEFEFLERLPDGSLHPGVAALRLGNAASRSSSLLEASERPLRRLADATGETVNLAVLTQDRVLYLARIRNADLVTANVQVGSTLPAPYTSIGKLLLSYLEPDEVRTRLGPDSFPDRAGPNAIRDIDALLVHLQEIRSQGYAIQNEELAAGLRSISVAVVPGNRAPVAALNIAVAGSGGNTDALVSNYLEPLRATAAEIAMRLDES